MLKNLGIDLRQSEKKTLIYFLSLYTFFCLVIIIFISFLYYSFQKDLMLQKNRIVLQEHSKDFLKRLKDLHINFDKYKYYPRDEEYNSAIYDSDKKLIFSTLKEKNVSFNKVIYLNSTHLHYLVEPESYYLGAKYVIIEIKDKNIWHDNLRKEILFFSCLFLVFLVFLGYFLLKLFLKPMRDSFYLLDNFIKDTTHELNTPLMTILSNLEMLKELPLEKRFFKKINRIELAAKTVSSIYDDLTYLTLNNKLVSFNETLDFSKLVNTRVEYFAALASLKNITFILDIDFEVLIFSDKKKISKLIDNLISNAIKYNKLEGFIKIKLKNNYFSIEDSGLGIKKENLKKLFSRYTRFSNEVGGFGLGLNIVELICKEYNINIKVQSELNKGTIMELAWEN